jgi:hypothetical protein
MGLCCQRPDEPQTAGRIRKDPQYSGSSFDLSFDLFIEALQDIGGLQVLVV